MNTFTLADVGAKSCNIYFTGVCNLNCVYCFQPKLKGHMTRENENIKRWIISGKIIEDIKNTYGTDLEGFSLWGGEPTLNLPELCSQLENFYKEFPVFKEIQFSTNFSTLKILEYVKSFIKEIKRCNDLFNRNVHLSIQVSIDGIPEINDKYRIGASGDQIMKNVTDLLNFITVEKINRIHLSFKGTHGAEGVKWLSDPENLKKHYDYFDSYRAFWEKEKFSIIPRAGEYLTFVTPGHFTQEDGINFYKITKTLLNPDFRKGPWKYSKAPCFENQISDKVERTVNGLLRNAARLYKGELAANTTCGSGRGQIGISYDGQIHWCHSTYFHNQEVRNQIEKEGLISTFEKDYGFSFQNYENFIKNVSVSDQKNDLSVLRSLEIPRNLNRYFSLRIQYFDMLIHELCIAGQISPCYEDPLMRDLAVAFMLFGGHECIANNTWEFGSPWIRNTDIFKLVLNGAFELLLEEARKK